LVGTGFVVELLIFIFLLDVIPRSAGDKEPAVCRRQQCRMGPAGSSSFRFAPLLGM